ncbi:hypothetical protein PO909_000846 [Leuciscus waleckii]
MDSRFAHLYKRDSSVSMIRLKMSRRRSQSQKENREKIQNLRRHLDQLPEIELSMDASSITATQGQAAKTKTANDANSAAEERKKMLSRYKENKLLQKEKEKREKEKKGVFKVGLYKPQPLGYLPSNTAVPGRGKIAETNQSTRVTRSMMQNQKPAVERHTVPKKVEAVSTTRAPAKNNGKALTSIKTRAATVEPSVRAPTTRSAAKATPAAVVKPVAADSSAMKTRSTVKCPAAPSSGREKAIQGDTNTAIENKPAEKKDTAVNPLVPEEEEPKAAPPSFAPQGFVFQPPVGLSSFEPAPLSPQSASAFLSPSFLSEASKEPTFPSPPKPVHLTTSFSSSPPPLSTLPPDLPTTPPPPVSSPPPVPSSPQPSTSAAPPAPLAPLEPQHDVAYFSSPPRELHTDVEMTGIQDAEDATGLDFERYLQPSVRDSMSPGLAAERFSLGVEDAEMESPVAPAEERPLDVLATPTVLPRMVFTPGTSQMSDNLLLFTPEQKERVRPSMCERDLIMFTPPTNQ